MTRKDYELIAGAFRKTFSQLGGCERESEGVDAVYTAMMDMGIAFKADNPRFDLSRFVEACLKDG